MRLTDRGFAVLASLTLVICGLVVGLIEGSIR